MDFEMQDVVNPDTMQKSWDFMIRNGKLATLDYAQAERQRAIIAAYLQRGTIPQMPTTGNQWAELLTGTVTPQLLNSQVRNSITDMTGNANYAPAYFESEGKFMVEVKGV